MALEVLNEKEAMERLQESTFDLLDVVGSFMPILEAADSEKKMSDNINGVDNV